MLGQSWKVASEAEFILLLKTKKSTNVKTKEGIYQEMRGLGLSPGTKLFLNDVNLTKEKGFGEFNLAGKWKKTYRGFPTKEPWYILTNFGDLETAIMAIKKDLILRRCSEILSREAIA